jgi:site-specific DNA recombinase
MVYLLRGVMKCGLCGLSFCGSKGRPGVWWYRCNGYLAERGGKDHRCLARSIRNTDIEPQVWQDIEALLRDPGTLLEQLKGEASGAGDDAAAVAEAQRITLQAALADLEPRRKRNLDVHEIGRISLEVLNQRLDEIDEEGRRLQQELDAIEIPEPSEEPLDPDLLAAIYARLNEGLTDHQRSEIVRLLVKQITVHTTAREDGRKDVKLVIEYRFSAPRCSHDSNGKDSSPPRA